MGNDGHDVNVSKGRGLGGACVGWGGVVGGVGWGGRRGGEGGGRAA